MGYTPPFFNVRKIAGGISIYPEGVTTDDLTIASNPTDVNPRMVLNGNAGIFVFLTSGNYLTLYDGINAGLSFATIGTDTIVWSRPTNNDLYLQTTGTGKVKFGTYTSGAATDSTGYISIIDAGGTARKLMVQA